MTRNPSSGIPLFGKFNKMNFDNIPNIETAERAVYEKIKAFLDEKKEHVMSELSNDEMYRMGRLAAKCHLVNIRNYIRKTGIKKFSIEYAFYFLRLYEFRGNKPILTISNNPFYQNLFYVGGYAEIIDSFFGEPIIKNAHPPYSYTVNFEVSKINN